MSWWSGDGAVRVGFTDPSSAGSFGTVLAKLGRVDARALAVAADGAVKVVGDGHVPSLVGCLDRRARAEVGVGVDARPVDVAGRELRGGGAGL